MSREARRFRRELMKTRSTFEPMPKRPSTRVDAVERVEPSNHGYPSIFWGFVATVVLVAVMVGIGLIAVSVR